MKLAICSTCGACFQPNSYEKICEDCSKQARKASPVFCEIEEAFGRCEGYMKGICEACLDFCAAEDWIGWRAVNGCEWWREQGVVLISDQRRQSDGTRVYQETYPGSERDTGEGGEDRLLAREILDIFADGARVSVMP